MGQQMFSLSPRVVTECVGADVVVMLPDSTDVLRLSGEAAGAIRSIEAGEAPVVPEKVLADLIDRGVLVTKSTVSRRGLFKAGSIGAGAGIAVLAMPSVAAASSGIPVDGVWFVFGATPATAYFYVVGFDFPDVGDSDTTPPGTTTPSQLLMLGERFPVLSWRSSQATEVDGDNIIWTATEDDTDRAWLVIADSAPTLTGTFTWDGQPYVATFVYTPPTPP